MAPEAASHDRHHMKITDIELISFTVETSGSRTKWGYGSPAPKHMATHTLTRISADDGSEGFSEQGWPGYFYTALPEEIDDLVLVKRRAQLGGGHRFLLDILHEPLAIFGAVLLGGLLDQHGHFLPGHLDAVRLTDFGEPQAQAHAALGNAAVIVLLALDFLQRLGRILVARGFLLELGPDLFELGIDHALGHLEIVARGQLVEQLALHLGARQAGGFLLELAAQKFLQLVEALEAEVLGELVVDLRLVLDPCLGLGR